MSAEEDYSQIPDADPPPNAEDEMSAKEEVDLSAGKHQRLTQRTFIKHLRKQIDEQQARLFAIEGENKDLRKCENKLTEYITKDRFVQTFTFITSAAMS